MMKPDTKFLEVAAIVATVAVASLAAQIRAPFGGSGRGLGMPGLERLALTEEQRSDLQTLFAAQRESGRPTVEQGAQLERELQQALVTNPSDLETLHALITKISDAQRAQLEARVALQQKIIQILTPAQRQQLAEFYAAAPERRGPPR